MSPSKFLLRGIFLLDIIFRHLKVLSNGTGGGVWVVSIDRPLISHHFRQFKKNYLKDPRPLNNKKRFWAAKQLSEGRHWIKELAGLKTGKKQNRGAPYLLSQHNSGCRRIKLTLLDTNSVKNVRNCLNSVRSEKGGVGLENPPKCIVLTKNLRNFKQHTVIIICVKPQSHEFRHAYA